jgi:hypothetical protein
MGSSRTMYVGMLAGLTPKSGAYTQPSPTEGKGPCPVLYMFDIDRDSVDRPGQNREAVGMTASIYKDTNESGFALREFFKKKRIFPDAKGSG